MPRPLSGVRVLDLSRVLAGPWAGQILADLGAEVIKVERPGRGDDTRAWGPPYLRDASGARTSESAYYLCANRGKRSVEIDIANPKGQDLVHRLADRSDVLIENFKVGGLAKYHLDYPSLSATNPRLIYCSITGFGQTGPWRNRPGYDFMIQGTAGLMSVTGQPDDAQGAGPVKVGVAVSDLLTGLYSVIAIQAILLERATTGKGKHIDMALFDVQAACLANQALNYLTSGLSPTRLGNAHPNIVPYEVFPTLDGHIILAVGNDTQFAQFCALVKQPQWAQDRRFATNAQRIENRVELARLIAAETKKRTSSLWLADLERAGVPCGPINTVAQALNHPQAVARDLVYTVGHPLSDACPQVALPIKVGDTRLGADNPPPTLGQHTHEVLSQLLELDSRTLAALVKDAVIGPLHVDDEAKRRRSR